MFTSISMQMNFMVLRNVVDNGFLIKISIAFSVFSVFGVFFFHKRYKDKYFKFFASDAERLTPFWAKKHNCLLIGFAILFIVPLLLALANNQLGESERYTRIFQVAGQGKWSYSGAVYDNFIRITDGVYTNSYIVDEGTDFRDIELVCVELSMGALGFEYIREVKKC